MECPGSLGGNVLHYKREARGFESHQILWSVTLRRKLGRSYLAGI